MKKTMNLKRIMSLFAVVVLMFSFMTATVSAATTASDAKNGVVAIQSQDGGWGTGFAIGKKGQPVEYIVTNNHVVNNVENGVIVGEPHTTATVYFNLAANKMMLANVCYYNESKDIAILKLPEATTERVPLTLCSKEDLDPDDVYYALGYPGTSIEITEWLQFSPNDITTTRGGIKKNDTFEGVDVFYLDLNITFGNSGGPLVNSKGQVAGINRGAVNYENQAIVIDELIKILNAEEIPYSQAGEINWFLIAGGVVLVLIIALVIVLIVRKKNNNGDDNYAGTNYTMPLDNGANRTMPKQAPAAGKASARVIAIGGTLNGKRYSVTGTVKVGRDSSKCAIAFPVNTQGVSGIHCEVAFDGAVCYVKDLNSSYGTFTIDGKKLTPNVPQILQSGEKFYLASPENTFEVRF